MQGSSGESHGRMMQRTGSLRLTVAGILLLLVVLLPVVSLGASTQVRVSASIRPWLKFSAVPLVNSYQVDAAAIRRGYVDIPSSLAVEVATNTRSEVLLDLASGGGEAIQVLDGGAGSSGTLRFAAANSNAPVARSFSLRVLLPAGTGEGTYPLNVQVSAAMI